MRHYDPDDVRLYKYDFFNSTGPHALLGSHVQIWSSMTEEIKSGIVCAMTLTPAGMTIVFNDWDTFTWTWSLDVKISAS